MRPKRIDHRGDARIGRARDGKAFLDGAHPRDQQMLQRPRPGTEPGIVGDIDQPAGTLTALSPRREK